MSLLEIPGRFRRDKDKPNLPDGYPESAPEVIDIDEGVERDPELIRATVTNDYQRLLAFDNDEPFDDIPMPDPARRLLEAYRPERDKYRTQLDRFAQLTQDAEMLIGQLKQAMQAAKSDLDNSLKLAAHKLDEIAQKRAALIEYEKEHHAAQLELEAAEKTRQELDAALQDADDALLQARTASAQAESNGGELVRTTSGDTADELDPVIGIEIDQLTAAYLRADNAVSYDPNHWNIFSELESLQKQQHRAAQDATNKFVRLSIVQQNIRDTKAQHLAWMRELQRVNGDLFADLVLDDDGDVDTKATLTKFDGIKHKINEFCETSRTTYGRYEASNQNRQRIIESIKQRATAEVTATDGHTRPLYAEEIPSALADALECALDLELLVRERDRLQEERASLTETYSANKVVVAEENQKIATLESYIEQVVVDMEAELGRLRQLDEQTTHEVDQLKQDHAGKATVLEAKRDAQLARLDEYKQRYLAAKKVVLRREYGTDDSPFFKNEITCLEAIEAQNSDQWDTVIQASQNDFDALRAAVIKTLNPLDHAAETYFQSHLPTINEHRLQETLAFTTKYKEQEADILAAHKKSDMERAAEYEQRYAELATGYQAERTEIIAQHTALKQSLEQARSQLAASQRHKKELIDENVQIRNEQLPATDNQIKAVITNGREKSAKANDLIERYRIDRARLAAATTVLTKCLDEHEKSIEPYRQKTTTQEGR